ncbi:DUF4180 domain-containing protein [Deinococcus roseus]|uniref:PadR family transcriptional regulator n=1 Tax=Deinococcus roseus TaxID=392414 RepID=A0ABQ2D189_9DEIO|nr:DUF4180 domain-containing protein [Deinococcus roseus]GGJ39581.1 PadR family transcriptional regulator [Deinococcus roseus]
MSIKHAILGLLSWKPATGYDLKKHFEGSPEMHWSGNNNQIYKALVQLSDEGLVTNETQHQDGAPTKKLYSLTETGLQELRQFVLTRPELPEFRKPFLVQLAWADQLSDEDLSDLITRYEDELEMGLRMLQESHKRNPPAPQRTTREKLLWKMMQDSLITSYHSELDWVMRLRKELDLLPSSAKGKPNMNHQVIHHNNKTYIEVFSASAPLKSEQDTLDLVALSWQEQTPLLMLHEQVLSEEFFQLRTGVAGAMLQKITNYHLKTALIVPDWQQKQLRFREMAAESNQGQVFRVFENREDAESWLVG